MTFAIIKKQNKIVVQDSQGKEFAANFENLKKAKAKGILTFEGERLFCNFFSPVEFYLEGDTQFTGYLALENGAISIRDCSLVIVGSPHLFIHNKSLRFMRGDIAPKWVEMAAQAPFSLEEKKIQEMLRWCEEDPFPRLVLKREAKSVFPILKLTDAFGAFANLWLAPISHTISSEAAQDGASDLFSPGRKHCPSDKESPGEGEDDATDCQIRLRECEKWGLDGRLFERHLEKSEWEKDLLESDYIYRMEEKSRYFCPLDKVTKSLAFLLECGWTILDAAGRKIFQKSKEEISYTLERRAIFVKGQVDFGGQEASVSSVAHALQKKERFVPLKEGCVGLLDHHDPSFGPLLECEWVCDVPTLKRCHVGSLPEKVQAQFFIKEQADRSTSFNALLRPYQERGVEWMQALYTQGFSGLLADDMGLGKTVQVLAFLARHSGPHLIVVPTSLLFHWKREIERFAPGLDYQLISFHKLREHYSGMAHIPFKTIILDEAQVIKNPRTQIATALCALKSDFRLSLTGTPVENRLEELWSHFHFLMPELLGEKEHFNTLSVPLLRKRIAPFFLRRTKEEVAEDLPQKIEQVVLIEMDASQRSYYKGFISSLKQNLLKKVSLDGLQSHRMEIFEALLRLRQICCHPLLLGQEIPSGKWDVVKEDVEQLLEEGKKVLLFSQFTSVLKMMRQEWKEVLYLDGETKDRESVVKEFQENPEKKLFLVSLKAGGVGLNLTAADYVLLFDPWWNEAVERQAIDRAHRIGRKETVIAKRYITRDSIEERMMDLKAKKTGLSETIFSEEEIHYLIDIHK